MCIHVLFCLALSSEVNIVGRRQNLIYPSPKNPSSMARLQCRFTDQLIGARFDIRPSQFERASVASKPLGGSRWFKYLSSPFDPFTWTHKIWQCFTGATVFICTESFGSNNGIHIKPYTTSPWFLNWHVLNIGLKMFTFPSQYSSILCLGYAHYDVNTSEWRQMTKMIIGKSHLSLAIFGSCDKRNPRPKFFKDVSPVVFYLVFFVSFLFNGHLQICLFSLNHSAFSYLELEQKKNKYFEIGCFTE